MIVTKLFSIIKNNSKSMNTRHLKAIDEFTPMLPNVTVPPFTMTFSAFIVQLQAKAKL